ncbi:MAG: AAA family ATPase [Peptostreptococcaceae bacterium]|nr:AAA family ATPase [Peptostreptococcaceae bacterium]
MTKYEVSELAKKYGMANERMFEYLEYNNNNVEVSDGRIVVLQTKELTKALKKLEINKIPKKNMNTSPLKWIKIIGLFGKNDYFIDFDKDINIWVSENGQGKTTILNIINAVLTGNERLLVNINFKSITVGVKDKVFNIDNGKKKVNREMISKIENLIDDNYESFSPTIRRRLKSYLDDQSADGIETLERYISKELKRQEYVRVHSLNYRRPMEDYDKSKYLLYRIRRIMSYSYSRELFEIKSMISEEVCFFPTYRRIEVSMDDEISNRTNSNKMINYANFGMHDVEMIINNLLMKMSEDANNSYTKMNGEIIGDLLSNKSIDELSNDYNEMDIYKANVVIDRIGRDSIKNLSKLNRFLKGNLDNTNQVFLSYYLNRLVDIYKDQEAINDKLKNFTSTCNKYLTNKKIEYNEALLSIKIITNDNEIITFDQLSSGEKQIVSVFSKVYLELMTKGIMVMDEPELSLSIAWQKTLLKDIYESKKIAMLIVATHSPFIFKENYSELTKELSFLKVGE